MAEGDVTAAGGIGSETCEAVAAPGNAPYAARVFYWISRL